MHRIAFNTANLVARETNWKFKLGEWGKQDTLTRERTDEAAWAEICGRIAAAGYKAVEIWAAHVDPARMTPARTAAFLRILREHGLQPIGLAGTLTAETAAVCKALGIPACNGGLWGTSLDAASGEVARTGIAFNYENHPEKSVAEIREKIGGGAPGSAGIGVALDTGWLGTQGVDAPKAVRELGPLIKHVHLKDVKHAGGHETCPLGEGVVDIPGVIRTLREIGYAGWYSWEDEPEDRNPFDIAADMRRYIEKHLAESRA